jgi:hypothetical protein
VHSLLLSPSQFVCRCHTDTSFVHFCIGSSASTFHITIACNMEFKICGNKYIQNFSNVQIITKDSNINNIVSKGAVIPRTEFVDP